METVWFVFLFLTPFCLCVVLMGRSESYYWPRPISCRRNGEPSLANRTMSYLLPRNDTHLYERKRRRGSLPACLKTQRTMTLIVLFRNCVVIICDPASLWGTALASVRVRVPGYACWSQWELSRLHPRNVTIRNSTCRSCQFCGRPSLIWAAYNGNITLGL